MKTLTTKDLARQFDQKIATPEVLLHKQKQLNISGVVWRGALFDRTIFRFPAIATMMNVMPQDKDLLQRYHKKNLDKFLYFAKEKLKTEAYETMSTATDSRIPEDIYSALDKAVYSQFIGRLLHYGDEKGHYTQDKNKIKQCTITYRLIADYDFPPDVLSNDKYDVEWDIWDVSTVIYKPQI